MLDRKDFANLVGNLNEVCQFCDYFKVVIIDISIVYKFVEGKHLFNRHVYYTPFIIEHYFSKEINLEISL